jgi:HEAT repeat protein
MMTVSIVLTVFSATLAWAEPFEERVEMKAVEIRQSHPEVARWVDEMQPRLNRAGALSFAGAELEDSRVQALIQQRLLSGGDKTTVRAALARALDGTHRIPWTIASTLPADVRVALMSRYKQHGQADAVDAFEGAMSDESILVRTEAMRLIGYREDLQSDAITDALRKALNAPSADVRRFGARAIAWRAEPWGFNAILPLLKDVDPGVRGAAVRALGQLDGEKARNLEQVQRLRNDPHPMVARPIRTLFKP